MYQRGVLTFAKGGDETIGGQLLAGTGTCQLGGQCSLQCLGIERQVLGQAIDKQVAEPHGVTLQLRKARIILCWGRLAKLSLSLWNACKIF